MYTLNNKLAESITSQLIFFCSYLYYCPVMVACYLGFDQDRFFLLLREMNVHFGINQPH